MSIHQRVAASQEWTTFTPSWTNLTVGNASVNTGRYMYLADTCLVVRWQIVLGSTSTVGTAPYIAIPNSADGVLSSGVRSHGVAGFGDNSSGTNATGLVMCTAASDRLYPMTSGYVTISATTPFTWATSDAMYCQIMVEVDR